MRVTRESAFSWIWAWMVWGVVDEEEVIAVPVLEARKEAPRQWEELAGRW